MKLLPFLFILFPLTNFAQNDPIKWGKIADEELQMNDYEYDQDADAVILCDYGNIRIVENENGGFKYQFNRHRRIKILKESGLERGDIFIPYQHHEGFERLGNIRAQVFLPNGDKQAIRKKEIFNEVKNKYWSSKNFSIPNLQVGSVFEYHYEVTSEGLTHLTDWYFQEDIPIIHSELKITIPKYFEYIFLLSGYELTNASKSLNASEYGSSLKIISASNPFILKDVPAIKEESFITCMDDYRLGIRFQLNTIYHPDGRVEPVLNTWEEAAKEIEDNRYLGQQYKNTKNHKKLLASAQPYMDQAETEMEKVNAACEFLQNNLKSSGFYSDFATDILDRIFEKKEVNSGEINLMLMALLKANNIAVYPLLVSTRQHGKMIPNHPVIDQFNHLMVYALIEGKETILDLGSNYRSVKLPRQDALNSIGWLVNGADSRWIEIKAPTSKQTIMVTSNRNEDGALEGNIQGKYSSYDAITERYAIDHKEEDNHWQKRLNEQFPEAEVRNFEATNLEDLDKDFSDKFDFTIPDAIQESGDLLYIQPVLYADLSENPLKLKQRFYPIDIPYPSKEQYIFNFTIPEGYEIESLPEALSITIYEKGAIYHYVAKVTGKQLQVSSKLQLNRLSYSPFEYASLKAFFDQVVEKMQEPVLLKKTQK